MPLRDHFHPPLLENPNWATIHMTWIVYLMKSLNRKWLPEQYRARIERSVSAEMRVDVGVFREPSATYEVERTYQPPAPDAAVDGVLTPEVRLLITGGEGQLVAAVEMVSEGNKDHREAADGFAAKIETSLQAGVSLVVVDVVTNRRRNLHDHWATFFRTSDVPRFDKPGPYAVAYHPYAESSPAAGPPKIDLWLRPLAFNTELPTLPLYLERDLAVPLELEETYGESCTDARLPGATNAT